MAEPASPAAKAEQRAVLVARLKRAASLPRMKDGRRPPMHAEAVSESEKALQPEESAPTTDVEDASGQEPTNAEPQLRPDPVSTLDEPESNGQQPPKDVEESLPVEVQPAGFDTEGDAEAEDRPFSPNPSGRSRRRRSRSRSRTSKDFKAKNRAPTPAPTGDSSPDEAPPIPAALPMFPALLQPVPLTSPLAPQFVPYPQGMFGAVPEALYYPGTSPPTPLPLPSLEAIQKGLMRSNSAGGTQASRRLAMAKLTGGTETYDPSPSPTPPPLPGSRLARNNTVAGGERIAARQLMLGRLAGRVAKETDTEQASGASGEDRGAPSPGQDKRRRRRSRRRSSVSAAVNPTVSDSDRVSTPSQTPVPPAPLFTPQYDPYFDLRAASATPNQASSSSRNHSNEHVAAAPTPPPPPLPDASADRHEHRRRSVLIEDDEDEDRYQPQPRIPTISHTPPPTRASPHISMLRSVLQRSDSPALHSPSAMHRAIEVNDSSAVPIYLGRGSPARQDRFPASPFATPLKEKDRQLSDDEEERVLYPADTLRPRTPATATNVDAFDREISWVATPVPEIRSQANDDDDDYDEYDDDVVAEVVVKDERDQYQEYDEPPLSPSSTQGFLQRDTVYDDVSPRVSSTKSIVIESEASADVYPIRINSSAFNAVSLSQSESYGQQRSPLNSEFLEWEDRSTATNELTTKRSVEASSPSTWEKMKSTFSRSGSSAGRRSRTNSILNRGDPRNSNISRESQGSLTSGGRVEKSDSITPQAPFAPQLMHSNSASASMLSLPQHSPFRGNPSPIPPANPADMSKYQSDKLFPFPGMKKLEEQRNRERARGFPFTSASTPDVSQPINGHDEVSGPPSAQSFSPPSQSKESSRERKDSTSNQPNEPRLGYSPVRQPGYIDLPPLAASTPSKGKLPVTFGEVKQWLSKNKGKKSQPSQGGSATASVVHLPPQIELQSSTSSTKKLSLSDLLKSKDTEISSDWEDTRTPTNGHATTPSTSPQPHKAFSSFGYRSGRETPATSAPPTDTEQRTPKAKRVLPLSLSQSSDSRYVVDDQPTADLAKPDRYLSATPDPTSSVSEAPPSTSESSSTTSSRCSFGPTSQAQALLDKLDDSLSRGMAPLDEPPRKLLFSGPVLQVVDPNTVKDRFLFLFNDILIIAKPILQGKAVFNDTYSNPTDKKYTIKSVVRFRDLRFCQDRAEPPAKSSAPSCIPNSPSLRAFIAQFAKDPSQAVAGLSSRSLGVIDPSLIAQVLFKTVELDRRQLGEYLSQRNSKNVLKAFLDNFGFTSLRIDVALRIFLHSIHLENTESQDYVMDHLQETFAGRWYEANAKIVAFDKDMALRLVRAIIQLNELLHGSIASEVGEPSTKGRNITSRDFYEAFRRYDPRRLVSDEQLDDIYFSIRQERLMQARSPTSAASNPDTHVSFMRPLPARLTYKSQSDPIIIRLPQPDPTLTLHLYGHDLTFEPPVLNFAKSPEASFRVTGTSLGTKTLVILRSGPNAIKYSGLPLSYPLPVERSFMRNTFQIAFLNHEGVKRRYMFSVDDHLMRHQWATSIRQQIEKSLATTVTPTDHALPPGVSDFYRAAEEVSFKVLQETLIQSAGSSPANGQAAGYHHHPQHHPSAGTEKDAHTAHRRSKSRSKLYPRQGAVKLDFDLGSNSHRYNDSRESNETDGGESAGPGTVGGGPYENGKTGGRIWSGRELELHCQQNSLIPSVLSHLQVGTAGSTS